MFSFHFKFKCSRCKLVLKILPKFLFSGELHLKFLYSSLLHVCLQGLDFTSALSRLSFLVLQFFLLNLYLLLKFVDDLLKR